MSPAARGGPRSLRAIERVRKICLALPEASEKLSHGEPTWFVRKRVFAMFDDHHHGSAHLSLWLPAAPGAQQALIDADPRRFFRPPYVGHRGWIGVVLDGRPDWGAVGELVEDGYREVAPKRLAAALEERGGSLAASLDTGGREGVGKGRGKRRK